MNCRIYKGSRQDGAYLYLPEGADPDALPPELLTALGDLSVVMDLELGPRRKLAREDVITVLENLRGKGFHLQMPPRAVDRLDD